MAKKIVKKEEQTSVDVKELKTNISTHQFTDEELKVGACCVPMKEREYKDVEPNPDFTKIGFATPKKNLKNISMEELIAYKNGCELVCRHYENVSRIDNIGYSNFNMFKDYAQMIYNEIEQRVKQLCNNK